MPEVVYLPEAERELGKVPSRERAALARAVEKLEALGRQLGYPHSSAVRGRWIFVSYGHVADEVHGGPSTAKSQVCSSSPRSARRHSKIDEASTGPSETQKLG